MPEAVPKPSPLREIVQPFIDLVHAPRALWAVNLSSLVEGFVYFGMLANLTFYFNEYGRLADQPTGWMVGLLTAGITICMLFFGGRAPMTPSLPYHWYDTPNVRFLSISDFRSFCRDKGFVVERARFLNGEKEIRFWPNLRALGAIFLLSVGESLEAGREQGTFPPEDMRSGISEGLGK